MSNKNFTETFKLKNISIDYKINEEKGIVVAIEKFDFPSGFKKKYNDHIKTTGVAKVNKEAGEIFNAEIDKKIARAKAEKEAFIQFKLRVLEMKCKLEGLLTITNNTIDKMTTNIQHQKEYIKSF